MLCLYGKIIGVNLSDFCFSITTIPIYGFKWRRHRVHAAVLTPTSRSVCEGLQDYSVNRTGTVTFTGLNFTLLFKWFCKFAVIHACHLVIIGYLMLIYKCIVSYNGRLLQCNNFQLHYLPKIAITCSPFTHL